MAEKAKGSINWNINMITWIHQKKNDYMNVCDYSIIFAYICQCLWQVNEYSSLKDETLYSWAELSPGSFFLRLGGLWLATFTALGVPIAAASFNPSKVSFNSNPRERDNMNKFRVHNNAHQEDENHL